MDLTRTNIFELVERRLAWTDRRQALLARNIANIATPSFQPRDLRPFAAAVSAAAAVGPVRTRPNHMEGTADGAARTAPASRPATRSPDGNSVALDVQLTKVADTQATQALAINVYKKYKSMFGLALGRG